MAAKSSFVAGPTRTPEELELVITRVFDAPRPLVFAAWTQRAHLMKWSAPSGFTITESEGDVRAGGAWHATMRSPDGVDHRLSGVYSDVAPNERIIQTHAWIGDDGKPGHETLIRVNFEDAPRGKTKIIFRQAEFKSVESRDGHAGGWNECFDRLAEHLRAEQSNATH